MTHDDSSDDRIEQVIAAAATLRAPVNPRFDLWPVIAARLELDTRRRSYRIWLYVALISIVLCVAGVKLITMRIQSYEATHQPAPMSPDQIRQVLANVRTMHSDHDKSAALLKTIRDARNDPVLVLAIIRAARTIDSSADKGAVLRSIARWKALTPDVRNEYLQAANSIKSKAERESVLSAMP